MENLQIPSIESLSRVLGSVLDPNQDPALNELVATYRQYFDHSDFLAAEWKHFIREFETKRSDEDKEATVALLRQQKVTNSLTDTFMPFEKQLDQLNASLKSMDESLKGHLAKEEKFTSQGAAILEHVNLQKEEEQVLYSKEMTAMQEHIDKQWKENVEKLEKLYFVPQEIKERMQKRREQYEQDEMKQNWFAKRLV